MKKKEPSPDECLKMFSVLPDYYIAKEDAINEFGWKRGLDEDKKYIFLNFDKGKIALQKKYDDYKYNIIIEVFEEFVKMYPNNKLEFIMDENNQ